MKFLKILPSAILAVLILSSNALAYIGLCCAHCGGNMPLNIMGGGVPETHEFRFKLSQGFMRMGPIKDGTDDVDSMKLLGMSSTANHTFGAVPTEMRSYMTMVSAAYSFTDDFAAMIMTGYKRNEMDMLRRSGAEGFTMFSDGLADTKVMGKYRLFYDDNLAPTQQLSGVLGVSAPTGQIDLGNTNHTNLALRGNILPFKMQTGTGTWDPILGITYQGSADPFWYGVNGMWTGRLYDNAQGYHAGDEFTLDLYGMFQFHEKALASFQLNTKYEEAYSDEPDKQKVSGEGHMNGNAAMAFMSPSFDPDNYGGIVTHATLGIQFQPIHMQIAELNISVPIYQNLKGPQLSSDWMMRFTYYWEVPTKKSRRHVGFKPSEKLGF